MSYIYVDTETTGLDPNVHEIWEMSYAVDNGPVNSAIVNHGVKWAEPEALKIGRYFERNGPSGLVSDFLREMSGQQIAVWELEFKRAFEYTVETESDEQVFTRRVKRTLVGANPAFDTSFLRKRWSNTKPWEAPWSYRLVDVEAYAMPVLGLSTPIGLKDLSAHLLSLGHEDVVMPDHTAAGDVEAVRSVFKALQFRARTTRQTAELAGVSFAR